MKTINYAEMARGYQEMGAINLAISQEFFHLENEGEKVYEMVTEKAEGEAQ